MEHNSLDKFIVTLREEKELHVWGRKLLTNGSELVKWRYIDK